MKRGREDLPPDGADPALREHPVRTYVRNAHWYAADLKRLD